MSERAALAVAACRLVTVSRTLPIALTLVAAWQLVPGLLVGPSLDASIFATVGWRVSLGDALYTEAWDHKPPGAYLPYVLAHLLTDDPHVAWAIVWFLTLGSILGSGLAVEGMLRARGTSRTAASFASILVALGAGAYLLSLGGGLSESFAILPAALSVRIAFMQRWISAGMFGGLALFVSLQAASVLVMIAAVAVVEGNGRLRRAGWAAIGFFAVASATFIGLWATGILGSAADAVIGYGTAYRAVAGPAGGATPWALVPWTVLALLPLLLGLGVATVERRKLVDARLALCAGAWLLAGIVLIALQGRFYAHYATPLVVPGALISGLGMDALLRGARHRTRRLLAVPLGLALVLAYVVGAAGAADEQRPISAANVRARDVANQIRATTDADDAIFVWGNDARVYELAQRTPASRSVYLYPLVTPGYATEGRLANVATELSDAPPALVVDSGSLEPGGPGLPPLLIDRPIATDGRDLDLLDPIRAIVRDHYRLVEPIGSWPIYVRGE